jgi:hypothetical protein
MFKPQYKTIKIYLLIFFHGYIDSKHSTFSGKFICSLKYSHCNPVFSWKKLPLQQCDLALKPPNCIFDLCFFNQLSGHDTLTPHALLCITVGIPSLHIMQVSNYNVVDVMTPYANVYTVLVRSSSYFRLWQLSWVPVCESKYYGKS